MYGFDLVSGSHNFFALLEFDITDLRTILRERRIIGEGGSLFAFMLKAIGRGLEEFPEFNSMIDIRKTTSFDEVDISIPIEVRRDGEIHNKQYVIRNVNAKSLKEITGEIDSSKHDEEDGKGLVFTAAGQRLIDALPGKLVLWFFRFLLKSHARVKKLSGTVFVTSVSMFSNAPGFIIPFAGGPKAAAFAIGSAVKKPVVKDDEIVIREMINITAIFNHDLIDGAPAARFINRFRRYLEKDFDRLM